MKCLIAFLFLIPALAWASTDQKQGVAYCISGFAESPSNYSSSQFLEACAKVKTAAQGKCVEGFASSSRRWNNASRFFEVCEDVSMAEATCIYGFARSGRSWNSSFFLEECRKLR